MSIKRNWMIYLSLFIYLAASLLILSFGLEQFQEIEETYLVKTILIIGFFTVYIVINVLFYLFTRPILLKIGSHLRVLKYIVEGLLILAILGGGVALRMYFLNSYPVGMESDYKFYYEVAIMIKDGTLTTLSNNEYISLFPHTYGYCYILSLVMRVFGTDPSICYYTNIIFSAITALFCYGIGRRIAGRVAGISALAISFFWPSQIIFSNINGAEAAFTCFLYGAAYLCLMSMQIKEDTKLGTSRIILRHVICGILIALSSAIRPMGLVLLIAFVICLLSINKKLTYKSIMDVSLKTILLSKGFLRAIFVLLGYFIASQLISAGVAQAIEKDIASGGAMGYSLMVGTNIASDGGYSEETKDFLDKAYEETESANAANDASMEKAIEQIKANPVGILELFAKKFYLVWSNDDYATTTNIVTMDNQKILTDDTKSLFYDLADLNNVFYLFVVFLSAIGVIFLIRKDNEASLFAIFFIGTIALFLLVEMQNRYHYFALQSIAILAAGGIGFTYEFYRQRSELRISNKLMLLADVELAAGVVEEEVKERTELETSEAVPASATAASKMNTIDVIKAIQEGHIRITATKAYQDEAPSVDVTSTMDETTDVAVDLSDATVIEVVDDTAESRIVTEPEALEDYQKEIISIDLEASEELAAVIEIEAMEEESTPVELEIVEVREELEEGTPVELETVEVREELEEITSVELKTVEKSKDIANLELLELIASLKAELSKEIVDLKKAVNQNKEAATNKNTVANQTMSANKVTSNGTIQNRATNVNTTNNVNRGSNAEKKSTSDNLSTQKREMQSKKNMPTNTKKPTEDVIKNAIDGFLKQRAKSSKSSANSSRNKVKHQGKINK